MINYRKLIAYLAFIESMVDVRYHQQAIADFARAQKLGVNGFPTIVAEVGEQRYAITRGYVDSDQLEATYTQWRQLVD